MFYWVRDSRFAGDSEGGGSRQMDPVGFVCSRSTHRSNLTGLRVTYYSDLSGDSCDRSVGGQQTGSSVRPVI